MRKSPVLRPALQATPSTSTDSRYCRAGNAGVGANSSIGVSAVMSTAAQTITIIRKYTALNTNILYILYQFKEFLTGLIQIVHRLDMSSKFVSTSPQDVARKKLLMIENSNIFYRKFKYNKRTVTVSVISSFCFGKSCY